MTSSPGVPVVGVPGTATIEGTFPSQVVSAVAGAAVSPTTPSGARAINETVMGMRRMALLGVVRRPSGGVTV